MSKWKCILCAGLLTFAINAGAQRAYTVTENSALLGPAGPTMLTTIYRDGSRALIDQSHGPDKDSDRGACSEQREGLFGAGEDGEGGHDGADYERF
jgi:hypothetical protein